MEFSSKHLLFPKEVSCCPSLRLCRKGQQGSEGQHLPGIAMSNPNPRSFSSEPQSQPLVNSILSPTVVPYIIVGVIL